MKKQFATLCMMIALALMVVGSVSAAPLRDGHSVTLYATLTGEAQVGPGDEDGTGTAVVTLNADKDEITFELNVSKITLPAAAAHIHRGAAGQNGPVVVPFTAPDANGVARGTVGADGALIDEITANPAGFYVNVHNVDYPDGAIRGQLAAQRLPATGASEQLPLVLAGGALLVLLAGAGVRRFVRA